MHIMFEPEGPLRTTGWLTIQTQTETLLRRWLDIGHEAQKLEAIRAAAVSEDLVESDLDARLVELSQHLESGVTGRPAGIAGHGSPLEWGTGGDCRFETVLASANRSSIGSAKSIYEAALQEDVVDDRGDMTCVLPVRGFNIPFTDVALRDGDSVVVERLEPRFVSVLGLVTRPGNFEYPPDVHYNLAQTIAMAGGFDPVADPRYVAVYRPKADGTVASATFRLVNPKNQEELTSRLTLGLKPGDVVSVEHTPRTRTNTFLDRIVRISLGLYLRPEEIWE